MYDSLRLHADPGPWAPQPPDRLRRGDRLRAPPVSPVAAAVRPTGPRPRRPSAAGPDLAADPIAGGERKIATSRR